jgi:hypothetical protein
VAEPWLHAHGVETTLTKLILIGLEAVQTLQQQLKFWLFLVVAVVVLELVLVVLVVVLEALVKHLIHLFQFQVELLTQLQLVLVVEKLLQVRLHPQH